MENTNKATPQSHNTPTQPREKSEAVRTRWAPKPEHILTLESIFNSGMVNPSKEETVKIRKMLEKYGAVGDTNVFYWFQNRRSRSRRRQRQMHAASLNSSAVSGASTDHDNIQQQQQINMSGGTIEFNYCGSGDSQFLGLSPNSSSCYDGSTSSSAYGFVDDHFGGINYQMLSHSDQMGVSEIDQTSSVGSIFGYSNNDNSQYPYGIITVFINGMATELPGGPIDMKTMFGADTVLIHSSGVAVPFNEYGYTIQGLHHGESYYLVSRPT